MSTNTIVNLYLSLKTAESVYRDALEIWKNGGPRTEVCEAGKVIYTIRKESSRLNQTAFEQNLMTLGVDPMAINLARESSKTVVAAGDVVKIEPFGIAVQNLKLVNL